MSGLSIFGVAGLPEIEPGADLAEMSVHAAAAAGTPLQDGDVLVVTSKIVSKAEGRTVELDTIVPSLFAVQWSAQWDKDAAVTEIVLREAKRVVRQIGPILITETHHGFVCANSGVDQSSSGAHGRAVLLPLDSDASARRIRAGLAAAGLDVAVIISDTFGRAWREGQTDIAIGIAGLQPILSYIGQVDPHGHEFKVQALCTADELAGAAELVKGNLSRVPLAVIRGYEWQRDESATIAPVLRDQSRDLFPVTEHSGRTLDPDGVALAHVRAACSALPEVVERPSHSSPSFFIGGKACFVMFLDDHHSDGRLAIWCAAPPGVQAELVDDDPERFFRPPYVGGRGWLGVRLDRDPDWQEVAGIVTEAWKCVAPKKLLNLLR